MQIKITNKDAMKLAKAITNCFGVHTSKDGFGFFDLSDNQVAKLLMTAFNASSNARKAVESYFDEMANS